MGAPEYNDPRLKKLLLIPALVILVLGLWMAVLSFRRPADLEPPQLVGACQARGPLSVGVGSAPIDLPPSSTIGGFPRFRWSAVGQRDPLEVRALVVGEPGCSAALVSAEILLVPWALTA